MAAIEEQPLPAQTQPSSRSPPQQHSAQQQQQHQPLKQHQQQQHLPLKQQQQQQQPAAPPPQQQQPLRVGELVHVKGRGSATVLDGPMPPGHPHAGRVHVRYASDGSTYYARASTVRRFESPPARLLVCETTDHYRAAAQRYAHPHDTVLEVGCSYGVTCEMLHQRCRLVVGVDKSAELVAESRARYPHIRFEEVGGADVAALAALSPTGSWDKIFIDIGGIAQLHTVMGLVGLYYRRWRHATLVVKSKYLTALLGRSSVWVPPHEAAAKAAAKER